jgi:endonuclease/exonuclease/phosphatase family metal-dependent hydrolase
MRHRSALATGLALTALAALAAPAPAAAAAPDGNRYGHASPRPRPAGTIRVASYNVLNLFDHDDDPSLTGEQDDMLLAAADDRCRMLAQAIRAVDADVIALEEVESLETLTWFRDTYLADAGYDHLASLDAGYYRGVENSVMSRFEITDARVWPGLGLNDVERVGPGWAPVPEAERGRLKFRRSPLMVEVAVSDDYRLTLFVVHHKSGRDYSYQREAEALKILELVESIDAPDRNIVILGDFNAAPWDKSLRVYLERDFIDAMDHRVVARSGPAAEEARLYVTHESNRVIDYILLNTAAHRELVVGSPHVYGTLTPPDSYDWRRDPHPPGYASDHYPIIVDLVPRDR